MKLCDECGQPEDEEGMTYHLLQCTKSPEHVRYLSDDELRQKYHHAKQDYDLCWQEIQRRRRGE